MRINKILPNGYFESSFEVSEDNGLPLGHIRADAPIIPEGMYAKWGGGGWIITDVPPPPIPEEPRVISKLDFVNLLTDEEYVGILTAGKTDVQVEAWLNKLNMSDVVVLNDDRTKNAIRMLVVKRLLSQNRANAILG
ncbi:MAG: hypothetical protein EBU90_14950 [Proteobacteria bacterium]|jgi:hypothetical protein|nr:hypothetical protein [Pseudomonadota bacterium]